MFNSKKFVIRSRGIILNEGKLLLVRNTSSQKHTSLPGGKLEWGEDAVECLKREIEEELGIQPAVGRLLYIHTYTEGSTQAMEFFFEVTNGGDYVNRADQKPTHAHEISEVIWAGPGDEVNLLPEALARDLKAGALLSDIPRFIKG
ncbi:MAG TPA: NUDIX hydrolase [Candidatus Paceibacterota bacterium]|nr:NUDIX hydrolase [Candidatus Paceibacterota bacterium]